MRLKHLELAMEDLLDLTHNGAVKRNDRRDTFTALNHMHDAIKEESIVYAEVCKWLAN